jgi:Kef-type K+ transport system membrane component KefB
VVITCFTLVLGWGFKYMNQPRVIAEVIAGIILGPTAMGRIPGFSDHIFPKPSIPYLNLVSTIGLILFLFVVGLEVDISVAKRNGKNSAIISLAGIALPFAIGSGIAVPLYDNYVNKERVSFGHFLLFICVALSITAFPVLCRILTATKLLDTKVGVIVLSAGVGNDVIGWVLLALTLALTGEGSSGVSSVYILLAAVGWSLLLLWPIKKGFYWAVKRSGSLDTGHPTPGIMLLTLMIVFISAFMTGIIGVHPIFGGFIAGLIIPHEGGFAIGITERIEDLVTMLFLPIYFTLSGLNTDLTTLSDGRAWGYVVLISVVGFIGKFGGCAATAKWLGYGWRESGAIGMLMSCKGLVELIVLNVGLEAKIIEEKLFSMMVLVAVILTFITTPCTLLIYPYKYHTRASQGELKEETQNRAARDAFLGASAGGAAGGREYTTRLLVVLQKLEHLASTMFITQLLEPELKVAAQIAAADPQRADGDVKSAENALEQGASDRETTPGRDSNVGGSSNVPVHIDALKLIELTGRTFSVMQSAEKDQLLLTDDALQLYRQFGRLRGMDIAPHISIVSQESFPAAVAEYAQDLDSELIVVPWTVSGPQRSATNEQASTSNNQTPTAPTTPFDGIFATDGSPIYTHFIRNLFARATSDIALFIDRGFAGAHVTPPGSGQHVFFPFFGGPDDRLALRLVVQLCHHAHVSATVIRISHSDVSDSGSESGTIEGKDEPKLSESAKVHQAALLQNQLTIGGPQLAETQNRVLSDTADNVAWTYYTSVQGSSNEGALSRIIFSSIESSTPLADAIKYAERSLSAAQNERMWRPLLVVSGRGRRSAAYNHEREASSLLGAKGLNPTVGAELRKTVGDPSAALILASGQPMSQSSYLICEAGQ